MIVWPLFIQEGEMALRQKVTVAAQRQPRTTAWYPRNLQSSLLKGDPQLQKTLHGGNESVIGLGASGTFVTLIQKALVLLGYSRFFKKPPDLHFGDQTRKAVEQFQEDYGLVSEGVVGSNTLAKLDSLIAQREKASASTTASSTQTDDESLPLRPVSLGTLRRVGSTLTGRVSVSPSVGLSILDNMAATGEQLSFLPEKGAVGQCSWFTIEGDPYVGKLEAKTVSLDVSIEPHKNALVFKEADLVERMKAKASA
ncbi:MAG TPA: peptidoglycan-binding domain-containing protein, partial [Myxococcaceae bacterium]|nr:peptidoglycan-binding domain-containing protein [Myxococcaceae bacterium]